MKWEKANVWEILAWGFWICCIARAAQAPEPRVALSFFVKLIRQLPARRACSAERGGPS